MDKSNTPREPLSGPLSDEPHIGEGIPSPGLRWALYARSGGADVDQVNRQFEPLRAYVAQTGGVVVAELADYGRNRTGRHDALALVRAGQVDGVAAWDLLRLGHLSADITAWTGGVRDSAAKLVLLHGPGGGPTDIADRANLFVLDVLAALTEYEEKTELSRARELRRLRGGRTRRHIDFEA